MSRSSGIVPVSDVLLTETAERIRTVTLNRPDKRNAVSSELLERLFPALLDAEIDSAVGVVILTGADPAFLRGLDLNELSSGLIDGDRGVELTKFRRPDVPAQ
jgi:enoyl-CoA hydratase/carnithine racemase